MEYLIIAAIIMVLTFVMKFIFGANVKKIKKLVENEKLDKLVEKFPSNVEVCKSILKKLGNEKVNMQEVEEEASLYIVLRKHNKNWKNRKKLY